MTNISFQVPANWSDLASDGAVIAQPEQVAMRGGVGDLLQVAVDSYDHANALVGIVVTTAALPNFVRRLVNRVRSTRGGGADGESGTVSLVARKDGRAQTTEVPLGETDEDLEQAVRTILNALGYPPE